MVEEAEEEDGGNGVERTRSSTYATVYSNRVNVRIAQFDIALTIAQVVPGQTGAAVVEEHFTVMMSPHHFKALVRAATNSLNVWERTFGEVTIPDMAPEHSAEKVIERIRAKMKAITGGAASSTEKKRPSKRSRGAAREKD